MAPFLALTQSIRVIGTEVSLLSTSTPTATVGQLHKRLDLGQAVGDAAGTVQDAGKTVAQKAPETLEKVGQEGLKVAGKVAEKAVDLAQQVAELALKDLISKFLRKFLEDFFRKHWKWLLVPLAVLVYYVGMLVYRWWNATKRQRRRNKLYREYVAAPPDCQFKDIRKDSRLKIHKKPPPDFDEECARWNAFRKALRELEEKCIADALQKEEERRSKTPSLNKMTATDRKKIENKTKKKVHGALRSFFRPGRLWGWIPDVTLIGLWDRRRFPQEKLLRGMKRSHFCHMLREVITVVAMSEKSREIRRTHEMEKRIAAKTKKAEKAQKVKATKNAAELENE